MARSCTERDCWQCLEGMCRFKMRAFKGGELDVPVREPLHSHFGNLTLQLYPPLIKQDFYQQYHQPTFWPYCKSLEECVVYRCASQCPCYVQALSMTSNGIAAFWQAC